MRNVSYGPASVPRRGAESGQNRTFDVDLPLLVGELYRVPPVPVFLLADGVRRGAPDGPALTEKVGERVEARIDFLGRANRLWLPVRRRDDDGHPLMRAFLFPVGDKASCPPPFRGRRNQGIRYRCVQRRLSFKPFVHL